MEAQLKTLSLSLPRMEFVLLFIIFMVSVHIEKESEWKKNINKT